MQRLRRSSKCETVLTQRMYQYYSSLVYQVLITQVSSPTLTRSGLLYGLRSGFRFLKKMSYLTASIPSLKAGLLKLTSSLVICAQLQNIVFQSHVLRTMAL